MNTIIRWLVSPFRRLFEGNPADEPKTFEAEPSTRSAWCEIVKRAPSKIRGGGMTEHAPDAEGTPEAPDSQASPPTPASPAKIDAPPVPEATDVVKTLEHTYPEGVLPTLPERPWGSAIFRVWGWGIAMILLLTAFVLAITAGRADVVPTVVIALVLAIPVMRSLTIAYLEEGLGPNDGARLGVPMNGSTVANKPPGEGGAGSLP